MTETKATPVDRSLENELIRNPLVRYLALAALADGVAQRIAKEFFVLGADTTPHDESRH